MVQTLEKRLGSGQPWDYEEAAAFLGLTLRTVQHHVTKGRIRKIKLGVLTRIPDEEMVRISREGIEIAKEAAGAA